MIKFRPLVRQAINAMRPANWLRRLGACVLILAVIVVAFVFTFSFSKPVIAVTKAQAQTVREARISALSVARVGDATVVSIRSDREITYRLFGLSQPTPRLVLDTPRVVWGIGNGKMGNVGGAGGITHMRFAHKSQRESRIVMDLQLPMRVRKQSVVATLGGKILRLELVPTSAQGFASAAPAPRPKASKASMAVPAPVRPTQAGRRFVIVIDAGHGGKDPGAAGISGKVYEKSITLANALTLRDVLRRDRRFEVVLTRDSDVFLTLERRILIARERRADLFISLHADSAPPGARVAGATVYTLSEEGGQRARQLLNNDNWSIAPSNQTEDKSVMEILRDLTQRDTKNQSAIFGQGLINELRNAGPVTQTSHRRAGFFVLLSPRVPAVLLELGFVSNPEDEARLIDPLFRSRQMTATARAIGAYFDRVQLINGTTTAKGKAK